MISNWLYLAVYKDQCTCLIRNMCDDTKWYIGCIVDPLELILMYIPVLFMFLLLIVLISFLKSYLQMRYTEQQKMQHSQQTGYLMSPEEMKTSNARLQLLDTTLLKCYVKVHVPHVHVSGVSRMKWRGELSWERLSVAREVCHEILAMPTFGRHKRQSGSFEAAFFSIKRILQSTPGAVGTYV